MEEKYFVYILFSESINQFYIGHTQDLTERLNRHTTSRNKSTKKATDWTLVYNEVYHTRSDAMRRELEIKKKKSRIYIEKLISSFGFSVPKGISGR